MAARRLLALIFTALALCLGQGPVHAQVIAGAPAPVVLGGVNPCKGVTLSLAFAKSTGANCLNGSRYASPTAIPGWTYTGAAGTGSYAAKADGSLQFFPSYTNLLVQSNTFSNASWTKTQSSVGSPVIGPDGTLRASPLVEDAVNAAHVFSQNVSKPAVATTYTLSASLSQGTRRYGTLFLSNSGVSAYARVFFDLQAGTVGTTQSAGFTGISGTIRPLANGFYAVALTATTDTDTVLTSRVEAAIANGTVVYTGTASAQAINVYGAQLELGSTASTYIPTTTAAVTVGTPRITDAGYWAEEARTNLLLWNRNLTNAAWVKRGTGSVSFDSAAVSADGTLGASLVTVAAFNNDVYQIVAAVTAASYAPSVRVKKVSSTGFLRIENAQSSANGRWLVDFSMLSSGWENITANHPAVTVTTPFTGVSSQAGLIFFSNSASTISFYADLPQLELGSFATSPIPTTSVAVTRAADVGYVSGLVVPSAFSVFASGVTNSQTSGYPTLVSVDAGSDTDSVQLYYDAASPKLWGFIRSGGATQALMEFGSATVSTPYSSAARVVTNDFAGTKNGASVTTDVVGTAPTVNRVRLGAQSSQNWWGGPIRRVIIYPRAFGNSELQAATIGPVSFANDNAAPDDMKAALWGWVA